MKFTLDLLKLLTEETGKLWTALLSLLKFAFSCVFAQWLFIKIQGPYTLVNWDDFASIWEFFKSGLAFITVFYFFVSYITLFHVLPLLTALPFYILGRAIGKNTGIDKTEGVILAWLFRQLRMVDIKQNGRRIKLLDNSEGLYEMATMVCAQEGKSAFTQLKRTVIESIGNTYFVFLISYFLIIPEAYHSKTLNYLVVVSGVLILNSYYGLATLLDLLSRSAPRLVKIIDEARLNESIANLIREQGIMVYEATDNEKYFYWQFRCGGKVVAVQYLPYAHIYNASIMARFIEKGKNDDKFLLLISRNGITADAMELVNQHYACIRYLQISDQADLGIKLKNFLNEKFILHH